MKGTGEHSVMARESAKTMVELRLLICFAAPWKPAAESMLCRPLLRAGTTLNAQIS
jgi:hypothetical protein